MSSKGVFLLRNSFWDLLFIPFGLENPGPCMGDLAVSPGTLANAVTGPRCRNWTAWPGAEGETHSSSLWSKPWEPPCLQAVQRCRGAITASGKGTVCCPCPHPFHSQGKVTAKERDAGTQPQALNGSQDTQGADPGGQHTTGLPRCLEDWTEQEMLSVCPRGQAHLEEERSFQEQRRRRSSFQKQRRSLIERDQELLNLNSSSVKWE